MKSNWQTKKLSDLCQIELGKTPYRGNERFWDTNKQTSNVWLSIADLLNTEGNVIFESKEYISNKGALLSKIVRKGTLLVSFKLTLGRLAFAGKDLYTNEAIAALSIKNEKEISKDYLYHYLSFYDWYGSVKGDAKIKGWTLNKAKLKEIKILYPDPLSEQKRIVKILDKVFEGIKLAKENTEKNLRNSKELFESYLNGIFANLGEDWENEKLINIFQVKPPKKEAREKLSDNDLVSFVPMEDMKIGIKEFICDKEKKLNEVAGSYTYFANEDILLAKITPCFENGKLGIARNLKNGIGFGSSEYIVFRSIGKVIPDYLYYFLSRDQFRKDGAKRMSGAVGHKRVSKEFIEESILAYPKSIKEQKAIVAKLDTLEAETGKLEGIYKQKLADLEELKKAVLRKAFSGEL